MVHFRKIIKQKMQVNEGICLYIIKICKCAEKGLESEPACSREGNSPRVKGVEGLGHNVEVGEPEGTQAVFVRRMCIHELLV